MARNPGIKDVAQKAQVSIGTVSNFLNGLPVSGKRSARIKDAIQELGFKRNRLAQGMRAQRSSLVGLCLPYSSLSNFTTLVDQLDESVSEAGYELLQVLSRQDEEKEFQRVERLDAFRIAGLLLVPSLRPQPILDYLHRNRLPTVILGRPVPEDARFDQVSVNHEIAMSELVRHLIKDGHRDILLIARFPGLLITDRRMAILDAEIKKSGQTVRRRMFVSPQNESKFVSSLAADLRKGDAPTAIIASNSEMVSWTLATLRQVSTQLLENTAMVCLQKPEWAETALVPMSYVEQPMREMAEISWRILLERIEHPEAATKTLLLQPKVIMKPARNI